MERLCNEVVELIFFELDDPTPLILLSKRFHQFSQDPYVRAHYFITRYGQTQALFWALGRGGVVNDKVLDLLLACGAHMSRYLIQVAVHHYFRPSAHFIKTHWVRTLSFPTFAHLMKLAGERYGNIPSGKGEDDGSTFTTFLKESRFPVGMKSVTWETISEILDKYKFIPFSNKDPIMAQFPLALSIEPRLLPIAEANGFRMDGKYRDFVFRKMFEKPALPYETRVDDIVHNVKELARLDSKMFLSRTVAAEICMEAKTNVHAYQALKNLNKSGELRFELSTLVEDLIKSFSKARAITAESNIAVLRQLFADFPSNDQTVRLVLLLTVFLPDNSSPASPPTLKTKIDALGLTPLTRKDVYNVLTNPFVDRHTPILEYAEKEIELDSEEIDELIEEVAVKCLEVNCKGKMLRKLVERNPPLFNLIADHVWDKHKIELDNLPSHEDEKACALYEAPFCRDTILMHSMDSWMPSGSGPVAPQQGYGSDNDDEDGPGAIEGEGEEVVGQDSNTQELGSIGHATLSTMIRQDEQARCRPRRRLFYPMVYSDMQEPMQVGRWIKHQYGIKSRVTAVFMTHAVINDNTQILRHYLKGFSDTMEGTQNHVPITLMHFKLLARLGKAPHWSLFNEIENGAEFYFTEDDYLSQQRSVSKRLSKGRVKSESPPNVALTTPPPVKSNRKRPRRSAAETVRSYAIPDSDDEMDSNEDQAGCSSWVPSSASQSKKKAESNLQLWIKHLSVLFKEEQGKYKEKKKRLEKESPDVKIRMTKNEFFRSLTQNLRTLRKLDSEKRLELYGPEVPDCEFSDGDDEEYQQRNSRSKRRKAPRMTI